MKKNLILTICMPAILLAGCTSKIQESEIEITPEPTQKNIIITARISGADTRVSYFEDQNGEGRPILHQQWNIGDWVYGFDDDDHALYLRVFEIVEENGERIARLENTGVGLPFPESGYIHMFYLGKTSEESESPESVDLYDFQTERRIRFYDSSDYWSPFHYSENPEWKLNNNTAAGIMTADAEVTSVVDGDVLTVSAELSFKNQMAIIGIEGLQVDPEISIDRIELSGIRTAAFYQIDGNETRFSFSDIDADGWIDINLEDEPCADEKGFIRFESPIFVAVFPRDKDADLSEIELRARVAGGYEGEEPLFYSLSLGKKTIEAGKYYYVPTKRYSSPPAIRVYVSGDPQTFSTLGEACDYIATLGEGTYPSLQLLQNCTIDNPVLFTTTSNEQIVYFDLMGKTLTLENGAYLEARGPIQLNISCGTIMQTSEAPVLVSSADGVYFEGEDMGVIDMITGASNTTPIQVTDGEVKISGGYFECVSGQLISNTSSWPSIIEGGRFTADPTHASNVVSGDGLIIAQDDFLDYPFMCLPESVYVNLAHTSGGVVKLFSFNRYGYHKVYLTKNNLYKDQNNNWLFEEGPNWEGQPQNSNTHKSLFTFNELSNGYVSCVTVGDDEYSWLNSSEWDALWNRTSGSPLYETIASYMKCNVEDAEGALWRNLLVFPDTYDWPSGAGEIPDAINNDDMSWSDAPVFTATQANALLYAGFVFLPAAVPGEGSMGFYGGYLSSDYGCHYIFNDDFLGRDPDSGGSNYTPYSLHVYYPCVSY